MSSVNFLIVDDREENLLSLEVLLRRDGLSLLKARSGDEALELLLKYDFALALVDVQMPGMTGFELAEIMRGNERTRRVPIIFVTAGSADVNRRFRGYEAGAVDYIEKPIEADILRSKAEVFFELYRQRQQIAEQRDVLAIQAEALREADRRKDEFLATLAHELRNPLAPLRHGLDLLRHNPNTDDAARLRDIMDQQLVHLVRMIDDLLDVSRVSQGKIELRRALVRVDDVIRSAIETSRPAIEAAAHDLTLGFCDEALWLDADEARLSQVVSNLLNNAAKYTPPGGKIDVAVRREGDQALIEVTDNGVGIPPDQRSQVFELFAQVDEHAQRSQGGLGIGLALVQRLVTMHGGTIQVDGSPTSSGSVFTIQLPLATPPQLDPPAHTSQDGMMIASGPMKVLLVDDNVLVAMTLGMMLEEIGHVVEMVHSGQEALPIAREFGPDVVLLDIGLPGMDGYEVCRAFREDERFKHIPMIAQTGWGQARDKERAAEAGFDRHLTKPVNFDDLQKAFAELAVRG